MAKTRKLGKPQKKASNTILNFDVNPDPMIFDMEFMRRQQTTPGGQNLKRGPDILVVCGSEQKTFILEQFKGLMGFAASPKNEKITPMDIDHAAEPILKFDAKDYAYYESEFKKVKAIHKKDKKDYMLQRGHDIIVTCGSEQKAFSLEGFKKLMGFTPGFNPPKQKKG